MRENVKIDTRRIDFVAFGCTLALGLLAAVAVVGGNMRRVTALAAEERALNARVIELNELSNTLAMGEQTLRSIQGNVEVLESMLPEAMGFQGFYNTINESAAKYGIQLFETHPESPVQRKNCVEMAVTVRAVGTYRGFYDFLFEVTHLPRLTKLSHLSIRVADQPDLCDIQMTVKIYAAKRGEDLPSG